jgi:hypothetical protein
VPTLFSSGFETDPTTGTATATAVVTTDDLAVTGAMSISMPAGEVGNPASWTIEIDLCPVDDAHRDAVFNAMSAWSVEAITEYASSLGGTLSDYQAMAISGYVAVAMASPGGWVCSNLISSLTPEQLKAALQSYNQSQTQSSSQTKKHTDALPPPAALAPDFQTITTDFQLFTPEADFQPTDDPILTVRSRTDDRRSDLVGRNH